MVLGVFGAAESGLFFKSFSFLSLLGDDERAVRHSGSIRHDTTKPLNSTQRVSHTLRKTGRIHGVTAR